MPCCRTLLFICFTYSRLYLQIPKSQFIPSLPFPFCNHICFLSFVWFYYLQIYSTFVKLFFKPITHTYNLNILFTFISFWLLHQWYRSVCILQKYAMWYEIYAYWYRQLCSLIFHWTVIALFMNTPHFIFAAVIVGLLGKSFTIQPLPLCMLPYRLLVSTGKSFSRV